MELTTNITYITNLNNCARYAYKNNNIFIDI